VTPSNWDFTRHNVPTNSDFSYNSFLLPPDKPKFIIKELQEWKSDLFKAINRFMGRVLGSSQDWRESENAVL
jgi:hypothetical protein